MRKNIVLVGMPGSGKTVTGKRLARLLDCGFVDTDNVITEKLEKPLPDVVRDHGPEYFKAVQERIILEMNVSGTVIATGGSVVYSKAAMEHLGGNGVVVYLRIVLPELEKRLEPGRRLARENRQSIKDIYIERGPLYEKYSDIVIDCAGREVEDIAADIASRLEAMKQCNSRE